MSKNIFTILCDPFYLVINDLKGYFKYSKKKTQQS